MSLALALASGAKSLALALTPLALALEFVALTPSLSIIITSAYYRSHVLCYDVLHEVDNCTDHDPIRLVISKNWHFCILITGI